MFYEQVGNEILMPVPPLSLLRFGLELWRVDDNTRTSLLS
jgi:hypothetical protein